MFLPTQGSLVCLRPRCAWPPTSPRPELQVWTVTETRHVLRSELPGKQREAKLAAARNEWGSFQILVRADAPVRVLSVEAGELRGPDGKSAQARFAGASTANTNSAWTPARIGMPTSNRTGIRTR